MSTKLSFNSSHCRISHTLKYSQHVTYYISNLSLFGLVPCHVCLLKKMAFKCKKLVEDKCCCICWCDCCGSSAVAERVVSVNLGFTFKVCCNNSLCSLCCYKVKSGICYYECCPKTNTSRGRPSSPPSFVIAKRKL